MPADGLVIVLYNDLVPLINSRRIDLLDHAKLINQLCSLERRTARGGRDSIDHPPGSHDDLANAAGGALVLAAGEMDVVTARIRAFGGPVVRPAPPKPLLPLPDMAALTPRRPTATRDYRKL